MKLPWPEIHSSHRPDETIRQILDYLVWIAGEMSEVGLYDGPEARRWRDRIQTAYRVLFLPPVAGHGDPYPPDVPPPEHPGAWPDLPAGAMPGMTIRHQLKVIQLMGLGLRDTIWAHGRAPEFVEWDRRLTIAREALDHGEALAIPEEATTRMSDAALAEAEAQETAKKEHQRRRELRLRRLKDQARRRKAQAAAPKATPADAAPKKKPVARKKAAPKKKPAAKKKAAPKKKAPVKKKAAAKKKRAARKAPAPKKR